MDAVGACVGIKGVRIQSIVRELGNERIDIVNYSDQPQDLIANALSPARVVEVRADTKNREALVIVPDDSYSLAIGNAGQNVKLASALTGFRLTVKSQAQFDEEIASPEARARLEAIFSAPPVEAGAEQVEGSEEEAGGVSAEAEISEEEGEATPLSELPGLTDRIIQILEDSGIRSVEDLIEMQPEELEKVPGIGKNTARHIMKILSESVEFEEI